MHKSKKLILITLGIIIIILLLNISNLYKRIEKQIYPMKYSQYVEKYASEYNVDPLLIYSIIKAESNFNEKAVSSSEAQGLMQLMNSTAVEMANQIDEDISEKETLLEPEKNIMIGTRYYSYLSNYYNSNMLLALSAYNAGIGNVNEWIEKGTIKEDGSDIEKIPFKETNMYVRKIVNNYKNYQRIYRD